MDRNKYLFNYVLVLRFAVHQFMSFHCNEQNMLTPNLTVGENNLLVKNESYIDVEVKGNLHLKCEGIEPFSWILPEYHPLDNEYPNFIKINTTRSGNKYLSELLLKGILVQDVGYYSCNYDKSLEGDIETLRNKYNSIYVFVTDIKNLFVSELSAIPAVYNSAVDINCKPSSSFTQITLWEVNQYNHSILEEIVISPQNGITFDPKVGFHLKNLKAEKFQCIAKLNDTTNKLNISLSFSSGIEYEPILDDNNITFVSVGDNFTLNCKIELTKSSKLSLEWNTKQVCTQDWKQRLTIGKLTTTLIGNKKLQMNLNISVTNAQLTDGGIYKCIAYDLANEKKEVTKLIKTYESPKLKLKADVDNQVLTCNQQFIFNVTISSVPNEEKALNLFWIKDRDIIPQNSDHFTITRNESELTSLRINNLEKNDSGVYALSANLLNTLYSNVSLNLTVNGCDSGFIPKDSAKLKLELKAAVDNQVLTCNQQFIFNVTISSVPNEEMALDLFWIKDGVIIPQNNEHFIITRNESELAALKINNLEIYDSGVYTLSANLLNTLYSNVSLNLTVNGCRSPFITKKKEERNDIVGNNGSVKDQIVLIVLFIVSGSVLIVMAVFFDI